jgi:putative FmdB family regulatory protein
MPVYEYICDTCQGNFEVRRSFNDEGVPACPTCNGTGRVRRKFSTPAIVFKGSGFYVTDARGKNAAGGPSKRETGESAKTETKSESTSTTTSETSVKKDD